MDYTASRLGFQIRKALRYVGLYGIRRTWVKIRGQYHMKRRYDVLPSVADPVPSGGHVGLIGCGNFAYGNIADYLRANYGHRAAICQSHAMSRPEDNDTPSGCPVDYVWETGELFLKTHQALQENTQVVVHPFDRSRLKPTLATGRVV